MSSKGNSVYKILDPGTFGSSSACKILVEMLNSKELSPSKSKHIREKIHKFQQTLSEINEIKSKRTKEFLGIMTRDHYINSIASINLPIKYETYMKNVINYSYTKAHRLWNNK